MSKTLERREKLRCELILAAERSIGAKGMAGLKTRELARDIGCANGAVYNLVEDMDELILLVGSRTLERLDASLTEAESDGPASAGETLARIAVAYCGPGDTARTASSPDAGPSVPAASSTLCTRRC